MEQSALDVVTPLLGHGNTGLALFAALWGIPHAFAIIAPLLSDRVADRAVRIIEAKQKGQ